jgi:hypothetical protein
LLRSPLDEVVHITTFPAIKETEGVARPTGALTVSNDVDVTTGTKKSPVDRERRPPAPDTVRIQLGDARLRAN